MAGSAARGAFENHRRYFCITPDVPGERRFFAILAIAGLVGWLDGVSGDDAGLALLYLIPISLAGWYGGVIAAIGVAFASVGAGFVANAPWTTGGSSPAIVAWSTLARAVIFMAQGIMVALFRHYLEEAKRRAGHEAALARTDLLTGLPNPRGFNDLAEPQLSHARAVGDPLCVMYLDLDNFKPFNEHLGHAAGDDILIEVAKIVERSVGNQSIAARVGGDEFVVLLRGSDVDRAEEIGMEMVSRIRQLGSVYQGLGFGATVGIARFETMPESVVRLITDADEIMFAAKSRAKGTVLLRELGLRRPTAASTPSEGRLAWRADSGSCENPMARRPY
jgi:diguanylate cyclase (GGDEF)-like protein